MVVYRCAASAVSWILIRRKICGPDELYELGKNALLSVDEGRALVLLLFGGFTEEGASDPPLDESAFLVLATREGLRCIFPSRILFCCTDKKSRTIINKTNVLCKFRIGRTLCGVSVQHGIRLETEFGDFRLSVWG